MDALLLASQIIWTGGMGQIALLVLLILVVSLAFQGRLALPGMLMQVLQLILFVVLVVLLLRIMGVM